METQTKKTNSSINLGLILGLIFSLVTVYGYTIDSSINFNFLVFIPILIFPLVFGIISIVKAKKENGGFISLKIALKNYLTTITIGFFISTLINVLLFNVVDPDYKEVVKKVQIDGYETIKDNTITRMEDRNSSDSQIEKTEKKFNETIEKMKSGDQFSIGKQIQGFLMMILAYTFIGLIISAILKKKNPNEV